MNKLLIVNRRLLHCRAQTRSAARPDPRNAEINYQDQSSLLQAEAFAHQALEAGFVEQVVGEFFVGEHGEGGALGAGGEFGGFFDGEAGILADHGGDHADHDLQAADQAGFVVGCSIRCDIEWM